MAFRDLSGDEKSEVSDWYFSKGFDVSEAAYRLSLVSRLAESKGCPVIDVHRSFESNKT